MAVGLEDANRPCGADAVRMKEDHDLPDGFLVGPAADDPCGPHRAYARDLGEALGVSFNDLERALAEGSHDSLGHSWANASHLPGGEILLDPVDAGRSGGAEDVSFELETMNSVAQP